MTYDPNLETRAEREPLVVERIERYPAERIVEREVRTPVVREVVNEPVVAAASPVDTARRLVWLLFGILQALIVLRIVLLVLGANEGNDLVSLIIGVTNPLVEPFRGMFRLDEVSAASGSVLDVAALVALVAWTLVEALVLGIVGLGDRRSVRA